MRLDIHHKGNSLSKFYYSPSLYIISLLNTDLTVGWIFLGKNTRGGHSCRTRRWHVIIAISAVHQPNEVRASVSPHPISSRNNLTLSVGKPAKMVDIRSKASKRRNRGKCRAVEDLPVEQDNSPTLSLGENSMDCLRFHNLSSPSNLVRHSGKFKRQLFGRVWKDESIRAPAWTYANPPLDIHLYISKTGTFPFK